MPEQSLPESRKQLVIEASDHIVTGWQYGHDKNHVRIIMHEHLPTFSDDTLKRIRGLDPASMNSLVDGITNRDWTEEKANDYISISEVVREENIYPETLGHHLSAFKHYDLEPYAPGELYPEERASQCKSVFRAALILIDMIEDEAWTYFEDDDVRPYIQDDLLRELLLRSDRREDIAAVMKARMTSDTDLIMSVLNHDTPALAVGVL